METTSTLTKINTDWKRNFKILGDKIHSELKKQEYFQKITPSKFNAEKTNCLGYYSNLFKIKNITGYIKLWMDNYPNHSRPKISISYYNKNSIAILKVAKKLKNFDYILTLDTTKTKFAETKECILQKSLARKYFDLFLIEEYKDENYLTVILSDNLTISLTSNELISNIIKFINFLTHLLISVNTVSNPKATTKENKKKLVVHLRRERNLKFKEDRKIIDNYMCQVCQFNHGREFGQFGFATLEVHHVTPLSYSNKEVQTGLKDLITLCANCHKMIHKMGGTRYSINKLKKLINSQKH